MHIAWHDASQCVLRSQSSRFRKSFSKILILKFTCINHTLAGVDFSSENITVTIPPGDDGVVIQFQVFDDQIQENSEENFIGLLHFSGSSTGAVIGRNAIRLIIKDDDGKFF